MVSKLSSTQNFLMQDLTINTTQEHNGQSFSKEKETTADSIETEKN